MFKYNTHIIHAFTHVPPHLHLYFPCTCTYTPIYTYTYNYPGTCNSTYTHTYMSSPVRIHLSKIT